jgi:hypothetical protein
VQVTWVIGTEVPASLEGRQRQEGAAGDGRTDLHRMAMRRASAQVGPPEEAPEELVFQSQFAAPPGSRRRERDQPKKGRGRSRTSPRAGPRLEATPELVSQDRRAGGESHQASEHRQILSSVQVGAGSNAGPHFCLGHWPTHPSSSLRWFADRRSDGLFPPAERSANCPKSISLCSRATFLCRLVVGGCSLSARRALKLVHSMAADRSKAAA